MRTELNSLRAVGVDPAVCPLFNNLITVLKDAEKVGPMTLS